MTDESSVTKVTHDRTKIAFGFSFRNHSFPNKIFHHFGRIVELLSFRLELKIMSQRYDSSIMTDQTHRCDKI